MAQGDYMNGSLNDVNKDGIYSFNTDHKIQGLPDEIQNPVSTNGYGLFYHMSTPGSGSGNPAVQFLASISPTRSLFCRIRWAGKWAGWEKVY